MVEADGSRIIYIIETFRPKQWIKNLLIFAGLVFSQNLFNLEKFLHSFFAFCIFCIVSGVIYTINDIADMPYDRLNPLKSKRPIASGKISVSYAKLVVAIALPLSLILSYMLDYKFFWIVTVYISLQILYTFYTKNIPILDVISISFGSVLRVVGGTVVIDVSISHWLFICTILLALVLALSKRRYELVFSDNSLRPYRKVLEDYNLQLLDQMIAITTSAVLITYSLYTMSYETVERFGSDNLVFTVPFVLYGIFRYLYLVYKKGLGESPEGIFLLDKPLMIDITLWIIMVLVIIYLI